MGMVDNNFYIVFKILHYFPESLSMAVAVTSR